MFCRFSRIKRKYKALHTNHDIDDDYSALHTRDVSCRAYHILADCTTGRIVWCICNGDTSTHISRYTGRIALHISHDNSYERSGFHTLRNMMDKSWCRALYRHGNKPTTVHTSHYTACVPDPFDTRHKCPCNGDHIPSFPHIKFCNLMVKPSKWRLHVHMAKHVFHQSPCI